MYRQSPYSFNNITDKKMSTTARARGLALAPVEVGTRGTVGSLLKKEIDYFRRLEEVDGCCSTSRPRNVPETTSTSSSRPSFRFPGLSLNLNLNLTTWNWRRKKRRCSNGGGGGVRPAGICSIVEVADTHRLNEIPGFSYRNLRIDSNEFEISTEIV